MRKLLIALVLLCSVMLAGPAAFAKSVKVTGVEYLPGKTVKIPFKAQMGAPKADLQADVVFKHGQSRIKLKYNDMKPAILFGGDVTSYVLWAVTYDGRSANLGEVKEMKSSGTEIYYSSLKGFALIVKAEPFYLVSRPSDLVMFIGGAPMKDKSRFRSYDFSELARAPKHAENSISDLVWDSKKNLRLLQARKAFEYAERQSAGKYAAEAMTLAASELKAANAIAKDKPKSKKIENPAVNAIQLSNTAINITVRKAAAKTFNKMLAAHYAELESANERSEEAEMIAATLANQQVLLQADLAEVESDNIELNALLGDALSKIATARIEAARIVLTLPGILFDTDKATLKPKAEMALAKLSGILMVFHRARVAIGGYTDTTGSDQHNMTLSANRAEAVRALLADQGVAEGRLSAKGYGNMDPIADNSTKKGRMENRRVELIIIASRR